MIIVVEISATRFVLQRFNELLDGMDPQMHASPSMDLAILSSIRVLGSIW